MAHIDLCANWRIASQYPHVGTPVAWHWAWEFLRRNTEYHRDFELYDLGKSFPKGSIHRQECFPPAEPGERMASYKRRLGDHWRMLSRREVIKRRWVLERPVSPTLRWNQLTASPFTRPSRIVTSHVGDLRDTPIESWTWPGEARFRVRLFGDVESQLNHIRDRSLMLQEKYLKGQTAITNLKDEYHYILRVYDLQREARALGQRPPLKELRDLIEKETEAITWMGGTAAAFIDHVSNPVSKRFNQEYEEYASRLIVQRQYVRLLDYESRRPPTLHPLDSSQ